MSDVEDYPGPTKGHEEKIGHDRELAKADETMVRPPARPEGADSTATDAVAEMPLLPVIFAANPGK